MPRKLVPHTVTKDEACRLTQPLLAGEIVMIDPEIKVMNGKEYRTAANVYHNGKRIAGTLILDNQSGW